MGRRRRLRDLKEQAAQTMAAAQSTLAKAEKTLSVADKAILQIQAQTMAVLVEALDWMEQGVQADFTFLGRRIPFSLDLHKDEDDKE